MRVSHPGSQVSVSRWSSRALRRSFGSERPTFVVFLVPALFSVFFSGRRNSQRSSREFLGNFGGWARGTSPSRPSDVYCSRGLKYSGNVSVGFATTLLIFSSFLASVALFDSKWFLVGSAQERLYLRCQVFVQPACWKGAITLHIPSRPQTPFNDSLKVAANALGEKSGGGYLDPGNFRDTKEPNRNSNVPYGSPYIRKHLACVVDTPTTKDAATE